MTGETASDPPQPGGRRPAPGALATLQAFVNTHYDLTAERGGEVLADPAALAAWLAGRDLAAPGATLDDADLARAIAVREGLRALALANNGGPLDEHAVDRMRAASAGAATEIRLEPDGPRFVAPADGAADAALGRLLAIAAEAMIGGAWPRMKACPGRDCGWVFFDRSRNMSGRWCAMKVCGDREKARAYYERHGD